MEVLHTEDMASVTLFTVKLSESEVQAYEACLSYVLDHLSPEAIEKCTDHARDELEEDRDELLAAILMHCHKQFLPERYRR